MKKKFSGLLIVVVLLSSPVGARAITEAERSAMQQQISMLIELINVLKAKLALQQNTTAWKVINYDRFGISYPGAWTTGYLGGGSIFYFTDEKESSDDYTWGVSVYNSQYKTVENWISEMGKGYKSRTVSKNPITINGVAGQRVVVKGGRTGEEHVSIFIDASSYGQPQTLFIISNEGNSSPKFESFYKSFKLNTPAPVWKKNEPVTARGEMSVVSKGSVAMEIKLTLYPPKNCRGDEQIEFVLDLGNDTKKTYTVSDCKTGQYTENVIYTPSLIPVFPELVLRQVDTEKNIWMNYVQSRYIINLSNPVSPTIQALPAAGQKG